MQIAVALPDGSRSAGELVASDVPPWRVQVQAPEIGRLDATADDLFDALVQVRELAEARGMRLLCAGARGDVYPSRMSRDMGGGRMAYRLHPGVASTPEDLVDIFTPADSAEIATVQDQKHRFQEWMESLR